MNEIDLLRQLGTRMSTEAEPRIDVAARVIQRIRQRRASAIDSRLLLVAACACVLSALTVVVTWSTPPANDSLASLSYAAVMSTGPEAILRVLE